MQYPKYKEVKALFLDEMGKPNYEYLRTTEEIAKDAGGVIPTEKYQRFYYLNYIHGQLSGIGNWMREQGWNWVVFKDPTSDDGLCLYGLTRKKTITMRNLERLEHRRRTITATIHQAKQIAVERKLLEIAK